MKEKLVFKNENIGDTVNNSFEEIDNYDEALVCSAEFPYGCVDVKDRD